LKRAQTEGARLALEVEAAWAAAGDSAAHTLTDAAD
jgi:hypothetical protein